MIVSLHVSQSTLARKLKSKKFLSQASVLHHWNHVASRFSGVTLNSPILLDRHIWTEWLYELLLELKIIVFVLLILALIIVVSQSMDLVSTKIHCFHFRWVNVYFKRQSRVQVPFSLFGIYSLDLGLRLWTGTWTQACQKEKKYSWCRWWRKGRGVWSSNLAGYWTWTET